MNTFKANIKKKLSATIENWVDTELVEWPPQCIGFAYQPTRPNKIETETIVEEAN